MNGQAAFTSRLFYNESIFFCLNSVMDPFPYNIRPIEPEKDAEQIAGLVRSSFRPWLDNSNLEYLNLLQKEGEKARAHPLLTKIAGFPYNLTGIVCTDKDGKIIGVINTYPFYQKERKCCLIANVCTAADYQNKGIATHMIREVERLQETEEVYGIYLQARTEAAGSVSLYKANGFSVTDYRKTWIYPIKKQTNSEKLSDYCIENVPSSDKKCIEKLLPVRYPASIIWNLDYKEELFDTDFPARVNRFLSANTNRLQRITDQTGAVKAWYAIQNLRENAAQLWLVPNKNLSESDMKKALCSILRNWNGRKTLTLDTPAAESDDIYKAAGFTLQHTLAWMWKRL